MAAPWRYGGAIFHQNAIRHPLCGVLWRIPPFQELRPPQPWRHGGLWRLWRNCGLEPFFLRAFLYFCRFLQLGFVSSKARLSLPLTPIQPKLVFAPNSSLTVSLLVPLSVSHSFRLSSFSSASQLVTLSASQLVTLSACQVISLSHS